MSKVIIAGLSLVFILLAAQTAFLARELNSGIVQQVVTQIVLK